MTDPQTSGGSSTTSEKASAGWSWNHRPRVNVLRPDFQRGRSSTPVPPAQSSSLSIYEARPKPCQQYRLSKEESTSHPAPLSGHHSHKVWCTWCGCHGTSVSSPTQKCEIPGRAKPDCTGLPLLCVIFAYLSGQVRLSLAAKRSDSCSSHGNVSVNPTVDGT